MTAYTGSVDTTFELNDGGVTNLWTASGSEYYYNLEFPLLTFESVSEGAVTMSEGVLGSLAVGEYAVGDNDTLGDDTLYIRMSGDGDPDGGAAAVVSIEQNAHFNLLSYLKTVLEAAGGVTQRHDLSTENHELIIMLNGYGAADTIYIGFRCYQSVTSDYYNMTVATMKGYASGNDFFNQPGIVYNSFCCHNLQIDYWLSVNAARINGCLKVGTPVYEHFGVGNFLPFAPPNQFPQSLFNCAMLVEAPATRYSDTSHSMGWRGGVNQFAIHKNDGNWYFGGTKTGTTTQRIYCLRPFTSTGRPTGVTYAVLPIYIYDTGKNIYGELDGIYHITGFDNVVENTLVINGENYVVMQDVYRTGFDDYIAMKLV